MKNKIIFVLLFILFVVLTLVGYKVQPLVNDYLANLSASIISGDNYILYDGEQGSAPLLVGSRACITYGGEVLSGRNGGRSLKMYPDAWHASGYSLNCGGQDRLNFTPYSYLEFYIKSDKASSKRRDINIYSYYGKSNVLNILSYVEGGVIDTTWRRVSIPLSMFKTSSYDLSTVDTIYFGAGDDLEAYYIDDVMLKKTLSSISKTTTVSQSADSTLSSVIKIYDGEINSAPLLASNCISYAEQKSGVGKDGTRGLLFKPDAWHSPNVKINCGGRDRIDMSKHAAIEFYIKADSSDSNDPEFNIVSYYGRSKTVSIKKYTSGGAIDTTWRLVSIPLSDLKTSTYDLSTTDDIYFGTDSKNRPLYIDNLIVTNKRSSIPSSSTSGIISVVPLSGATRPQPAPAPLPVVVSQQHLIQTQPQPQIPPVEAPPILERPLTELPVEEPPVVPSVLPINDTSDFDEVDLANIYGSWIFAENNKFVSLNFVDKYDVSEIQKSSNFTISSTNDPAYQGGKRPTVRGYRWRTHYAPTIRKTDLKIVYRVFLELPSPLKNGGVYTITAQNIDITTKPFTFTFNDRELNRNIKINQVGYLPNSKKIAYVGQYMGTGGGMPFTLSSFNILDSLGRTVFTGVPQIRNLDTNNTGETVYDMDFSSVTTPGIYSIQVPNVGSSYAFRIGGDVYNEVLGNALQGAYHQRAGTSLPSSLTRFSHGPAHLEDAYVMNHNPIPDWFRGRFDSQGDTNKKDGNGKRFYYPTSLSGQFKSTVKGHYDAGDYGKYVVNGSLFAGNLLLGFDAFPTHLMKDDLNIPESGNGIPDILDEVKWELDWLESMQDPEDGGIFCIVKPDGAIEYYENRTMDAPALSKRLLYPKDTTCTAHTAAVLAKAGANSFIKKHYPQAAARYIEKAKKAWEFLERNPGYLGWHHYGVKDEFDNDKSMDERVWASIELYNATGENKYLNFLQTRHKPEYIRWGWNTLFEASGQANYACAFTKRVGMDSMKERCKAAIIKAADSHVVDSGNRAYRLAMSDSPLNYRDYTYFFPQERIIQLLVAHSLAPNNRYLQTALYSWDYTLGANPTGYSYITGIGSKRFREVVSTQSVYDSIKPPVPGLPIGMGNNFGYLEVYKNKLAQMFPPNNGGSPDPKVSYPLLQQVYDGWNIGVEFTVPEIAENIISAAYFATLNDAKNTPPQSISITADKVTGPAPLTVAFKSSGVDNDGRVVRYHWDFDDESYSVKQNPVHIFQDPYKVYKVVLTVTDNDGAQKYKEIQIRTTPQSFNFDAVPHVPDANTFALFNFDTSFTESGGRGYQFVPKGNTALSSENILWMRNPAGKSVEFNSVNDSMEIVFSRKSIVPSSGSTLVAEAKIYVEKFISEYAADSRIFVLSQGDDKAFGVFDAKYVDGTHVKSMNGYDSQVKVLSREQIDALMKQGKMQTNTWYNLKLIVSSGKAEIYVNSDKVGETNVSPQFASSDTAIKLMVGGFQGFVDDIRVGSK